MKKLETGWGNLYTIEFKIHLKYLFSWFEFLFKLVITNLSLASKFAWTNDEFFEDRDNNFGRMKFFRHGMTRQSAFILSKIQEFLYDLFMFLRKKKLEKQANDLGNT